jgi:outer membrane lipoprotein SlyB
MNQRTTGAVSGAVSGAKVGGPWGAVVGGILGAARAGHAGQALAEQLGRNNDTTGGQQGEFDDMMSMTDEDRKNIIQGMNNGFGEL